MTIHMRNPKRGFNNIFGKDFEIVNLGQIQKLIDEKKLNAKATIDHAALKAAGVARGGKDGVRLLAKGELTAKLNFAVAGASKGAIEAVEQAGGKVELPEAKHEGEGNKAQRRAKAKPESKKIATLQLKGGGGRLKSKDVGEGKR